MRMRNAMWNTSYCSRIYCIIRTVAGMVSKIRRGFMKLQDLFQMQEELDRFIQANRDVNEDVFRKVWSGSIVSGRSIGEELRGCLELVRRHRSSPGFQLWRGFGGLYSKK